MPGTRSGSPVLQNFIVGHGIRNWGNGYLKLEEGNLSNGLSPPTVFFQGEWKMAKTFVYLVVTLAAMLVITTALPTVPGTTTTKSTKVRDRDFLDGRGSGTAPRRNPDRNSPITSR
ncbi:hypothetical protein Btru_049728 [Bulinus truncatus]|nr:hypothetical protein Btru_049728 [Bulinus truncatus]